MTFLLRLPFFKRALAVVAACGLLCACSERHDDFYPLDDGRWWYYETRTTILDEVAHQRLAVANLGGGTLGDHTVRIQRQSAGREVYFRDTGRGLERVAVRPSHDATAASPGQTLLLPKERSVGINWTTTTRLRLIESRTFARQDKLRHRDLPLELVMSIGAIDEAVKVPAGVFKRCIRIDGSGRRTVRTDRGNAMAEVVVAHSEWYAPGVGLVKLVRSETAESPFLKTGRYEQELIQYE